MNNNFSPNRAWNSVSFTGSNYVLSGGTIIVTNGLRMGPLGTANNLPFTRNDVLADIELRASQTFFVSNLFSRLALRDVVLNNHTLTIDGDGQMDFFGVISGTGGITKEGFGISNLETNNTFSGTVLIRDGRIRAKEPLSLGSTNNGTIVRRGALFEAQANVTNETLFLSGGTWFNNIQPGRWRGPVNVISNSTIIIAGKLIIDGVISGTSNLVIDAAVSGFQAECNLTGSADNTLTGAVQLQEGVLILDKPSPFSALSGPLTVGDGAGNSTNAVVRYAGNNRILSAAVTVLSDGTFDLDGNSDLIAGLTMIGGVVTNNGAGLLQLGGSVNATSVGSTPARIFSILSLGNFDRTFFVTNGPASTDLEIEARVTGNSGIDLNKDLPGVMSLLVSNSYQGITRVLAGTLHIDDDFAFGTLLGDRVVVHDGATLSLRVGADNIAQNIALNGSGDGGGGALRSVGTVAWNGVVTLASDSLINVESGTLTLSGQIDGPGGYTKTGSGTLRITGADDNIYTGNTEVIAGVLELAKTSAFAISNSAQLIIGQATLPLSTDTVRYAGNNQLRTTVDIVIRSTGLLDLNGFIDDVGDINMSGGDIQIGTGTLQLRGSVTASAFALAGNYNPSHIRGNLDLGSSTRTFTVNNVNAVDLFGPGFELFVDALVSGTGGIIKTGIGDMELSASNTFSGVVTVNDGRLIVANNDALGAISNGTTVNGDSILEVLGSICVPAEPLTLNSTAPGAVTSSSGTNFWDGPVALSRTAGILVVTNSRLDLSGIISGFGRCD
jgi:autotransporter-associated beta strand protein